MQWGSPYCKCNNIVICSRLFFLFLFIYKSLFSYFRNTKIGTGIGCLVNILSANLPTSSGGGNEAAGNFMTQIKEPVCNIVKYYVSHAVLTFTYIYTLAKVGECCTMVALILGPGSISIH